MSTPRARTVNELPYLPNTHAHTRLTQTRARAIIKHAANNRRRRVVVCCKVCRASA